MLSAKMTAILSQPRYAIDIITLHPLLSKPQIDVDNQTTHFPHQFMP